MTFEMIMSMLLSLQIPRLMANFLPKKSTVLRVPESTSIKSKSQVCFHLVNFITGFKFVKDLILISAGTYQYDLVQINFHRDNITCYIIFLNTFSKVGVGLV